MKIRWFGHACFYIISNSGTRILTDPSAKQVGYAIPNVEADIVTISHNHYDHSNVSVVKGDFKLFKEEGFFEHKDITILGTRTFHDDSNGSKRGTNIVFNIKIDGLNVCHLGDLGHLVDKSTVEKIGKVDVLLIPVGGIFTVDAASAVKVAEAIKPKIIIPMHYKTPALTFELANVEDFTNRFEAGRVIKADGIEFEINRAEDLEDKIIVMKYQ